MDIYNEMMRLQHLKEQKAELESIIKEVQANIISHWSETFGNTKTLESDTHTYTLANKTTTKWDEDQAIMHIKQVNALHAFLIPKISDTLLEDALKSGAIDNTAYQLISEYKTVENSPYITVRKRKIKNND